MKLNIYTTSHPIIQVLSNTIQNTNLQSNTKNQTYKQLGLFLIYETIRNWLRIYKLHIKQINIIKEFVIIDPKESYIMMTDINMNLAFIQEVSYILPNCNLSLINFSKTNTTNLIDSNFSYIPTQINESTKIIVIKKYIDVEYLLKLMDYLINVKQINIKQIRLTCIICEENKLVKISQKYPELRIYTTQVKNNLSKDPNNYLKKF
uniref:uracil phosphoribosyltransferase n=1 Tax=Phymatolithon calcareum TaxID=1277942 RepID=UPI0023F1854C|nr:uracil phosphoribosyltransferase [Phymatolithon calcareum]WEA76912.1 uracil phosphoribosyltransferase [Phymatolithon calcareum]